MGKKKRNPTTGQMIPSEPTPAELAAQDAANPIRSGMPLKLDRAAFAEAREYIGYFVEQVEKTGKSPLTMNAVLSKVRERYGHLSNSALTNWLDAHHPGIRQRWLG